MGDARESSAARYIPIPPAVPTAKRAIPERYRLAGVLGLLNRFAARAQTQIAARLGRLGVTPRQLEEIQRGVLWWIFARVQALQSRRPLLRGWGIAWTSGGYAELVPVEVPRPGKGQITVRIEASAVSPGTERAQYLHLPNAAVGLLGRPGYSGAGRVHAVGRGLSGFAMGDLVAVTGAAHASLVTAQASAVFRVPPGVRAADAALVQLGVIAGQGARFAQLRPGDRVAVVGSGPVGILALRLVGLAGAEPVAVISRSRIRSGLAHSSGAAQTLLAEESEAIANLRCDVVVEATGNPDAIGTAVVAARVGGRIVLLGSSRGVSADVPIVAMQAKQLTLVGAHVDSLDAEPQRIPGDARRREAAAFLAALGSGALEVADLAGEAVDPREAGLFYRDLGRGDRVATAHFDWSLIDPREGASNGHFLVPPDIVGRGTEPLGRPLRPRAALRRRAGLLHVGDPFAGATGQLRIGVVGCGDIALSNASAIAAAPNATIVATYDPVRRLAEDLAARFDAAVTRTAEELLSLDNVDAVLLCVPHHLHAPLAIQAAEARKHVVVEKPMAESLDSAAGMAAAADRAGIVLSVCFPQRFTPEAVLARRLVEAGALGRFQGSSTTHYLDKTQAYWLGGFSGRSRSDWRASKERAGGGVLIMNLSHHIDLVRHISGGEVERIVAITRDTDEPREVEDAASVAFAYTNGAVGSLVAASAVRGTTAAEDVRLWGSEGQLLVSPRGRWFSLRSLEGSRTARWQSLGRLPVYNSRAVYFARLATALTSGGAVDVTADDGLAVQAFIEGAYASHETGADARPGLLLEQARK